MALKVLKTLAEAVFTNNVTSEGLRISLAAERLRIFTTMSKELSINETKDAGDKEAVTKIFDLILSEIATISEVIAQDSSDDSGKKKRRGKIGELCGECAQYDCQHLKAKATEDAKARGTGSTNAPNIPDDDDEDDIPSPKKDQKKDEKGKGDYKDASPIPDSDPDDAEPKMPPPNALPSSSNDSTKGARMVSFTSTVGGKGRKNNGGMK